MKIRGLGIAVAVLLILAGALYWSEHRKPGEASTVAADTPPAILKLDESSITRFEIKRKDAPAILLAKANSGDWQITQPSRWALIRPPFPACFPLCRL